MQMQLVIPRPPRKRLPGLLVPVVLLHLRLLLRHLARRASSFVATAGAQDLKGVQYGDRLVQARPALFPLQSLLFSFTWSFLLPRQFRFSVGPLLPVRQGEVAYTYPVC